MKIILYLMFSCFSCFQALLFTGGAADQSLYIRRFNDYFVVQCIIKIWSEYINEIGLCSCVYFERITIFVTYIYIMAEIS